MIDSWLGLKDFYNEEKLFNMFQEEQIANIKTFIDFVNKLEYNYNNLLKIFFIKSEDREKDGLSRNWQSLTDIFIVLKGRGTHFQMFDSGFFDSNQKILKEAFNEIFN